MEDPNIQYIQSLQIEEIPWHRLTTAYGRATGFPNNLKILQNELAEKSERQEALQELMNQMEHQGTLWHATPFAMIFLIRIFAETIKQTVNQEKIRWLTVNLMEFFMLIAQCYHAGQDMNHADPLANFSDMLKEQYLWSDEYDEEQDEIRWEEEDVYPEDLFYSFYHYSYAVLRQVKPLLEKMEKMTRADSVTRLWKLL